MVSGRTDEFREDAVRIALTSGLTRRQVADDLGVGLSTLNKWAKANRDADATIAKPAALRHDRAHRGADLVIVRGVGTADGLGVHADQ